MFLFFYNKLRKLFFFFILNIIFDYLVILKDNLKSSSDLFFLFIKYIKYYYNNINFDIIIKYFPYGIDYLNLSYGNTNISENYLDVYNNILFIQVILLIVILWLFFYIAEHFYFNNKKTTHLSNKYQSFYYSYKRISIIESKILEFFWTLLPFCILFFIGYPSLTIMYLIEERINPEIIVKVIGHQWYWSYENDSGNQFFFSDIMVNDDSDVNTIEQLHELVRVFTRPNITPILHLQGFFNWIDDLYSLDVLENFNSFFNIFCIIKEFNLIHIFNPFIDKYTIHDINNKLNSIFMFIIDYSAVSKNNEFDSINVLNYISENEIKCIDSCNIYTTDVYFLQTIYYWVERLFNSYDYKYLWLDIDSFGDVLRYIPIENLLSCDRFDCIFLDSVIFDSYILKSYDLLYEGEKRLLEVDNRLVLPSRTHIQLIVTSTDVIHSFCVPEFGVKIDAIPGRLNQCFIFSKYEGTFFGQCSELCGVDHGFMPIVIEIVSYSYYYTSVQGYLGHLDDVWYSSGWTELF